MDVAKWLVIILVILATVTSLLRATRRHYALQIRPGHRRV
jgi:hypothetical protein